MITAAANSTFLIPVSKPRSSDTVEFGSSGHRSNFVADQNNFALRYFCQPEQFQSTDWPMVLFGVNGSGKTSLALSMVAFFAGRSKQKASVFTAEGFRRKFADALETDSVNEFRRSISESDILFVDDVQRLKNFSAAQSELASLLDILSDTQTPVICTISSAEMKSGEICPRLFSRLSTGLCLPVNQPGIAARKQLFTEAASDSGLVCDEASLEYLAETFVVTFPKIHSFFGLFKVWRCSRQEEVTSEIHLPEIIDFVSSVNGSNQKNIDSIVGLVGKAFKLKIAEIKSSSRKQSIVMARGVTIYLLRTLLKMNYSDIGIVLGGRDHSTIMHGLDRIEKVLSDNIEMQKTIENIRISILENCFLQSV